MVAETEGYIGPGLRVAEGCGDADGEDCGVRGLGEAGGVVVH